MVTSLHVASITYNIFIFLCLMFMSLGSIIEISLVQGYSLSVCSITVLSEQII